MDRDRLKRDIDRIENIEVNRKALGGDVRDIYKGLQGVGFNPKAVRKIVQARRMTAADRAELENDIDTYRVALGMAVDMVSNGEVSLRQASALTGVSKSSIHRALPVPEVSQPMHADDLGDYLMLVSIEEDRIQGAEIAYEDARGSREMVADDLGDPLWMVDRDRAKFREQVRRIAAKIKVPMQCEVGAEPRLTGEPVHDDLAIPDFLRRVSA